MLRKKKDKIFSRRIFVLAGLKASLLLGLVARLYYLQIVKTSEYQTFSDSNRIRLFLIPPLRGKILDRQSRILATNRNYYRVIFDKQTKSDSHLVLRKLSEVLEIGESGYQKLVAKLENSKAVGSVTIYEHLTWSDLSKVSVNTPDLPGISIDVGQIRDFPTGAISSHVVGYMGPVSETEIKKNPLLNHPDFKIGRDGIERQLEKDLRGVAGVKKMEVNAYGLPVRELSREESKEGKDVVLTLDRDLQEFVGIRMEGLTGCCVVMNVNNGDILSFVSTPGFDPNEFTYGVSNEYWKELTHNDKKPLINKALSNQYPPGSTFKMVVALTALKEGFSPDKKFYCPGYMDLGKTRFHCWKKEGHGNLDLKQAIMHSCNTYFYNLSKTMDIDNIHAMAAKFGFGKEIGIPLSGEKSGLLPSSEWKRKKYNVAWQKGDTLNVGIGQGYLLATPMQLALMTSRIASGTNVEPSLIAHNVVGPSYEAAKDFSDMGIPKNHLNLIREGMINVVNVPGGTAFGSRIMTKGMSMAGKTGTAQVISKKGLENIKDKITAEELEKTQNHALFVGFGPTEKPKYSIAVVIEHGGGGSKAAAPVARDVMEKVQTLDI
ncbi:MAG: penicillin-binding protein 2 [Alphaproteobacteria bacterium CG11_big_fil_rev_8_21_14_0_20_39_49]|nr:MAG: penicillin-binding protein 2 [Alphaproteobacteria bacterium CG11_big_fil_rev_8_21_14_0_20_39_49]